MNESVDNFIIGFGKLMGVANKAEISEILSGNKEVTEDMNDIQKTIASLCKLIKTLSKTSVKITDNICNNAKDEKSENLNRGRQGLPGRQGIQGERGLPGENGQNEYFDLEHNTISSNYLIGLNGNNLNSYMFEWDDRNVKN